MMKSTKMVAATAATALNVTTSATTCTLAPYTGQPPLTAYDALPARRLTEHFALREFVISATAIRHGIDNTPPDDAVARLATLCRAVLEPLRQRFGVIRVTSGYRSAEVNRLVGGAAQSQHLSGEAADISIGSLEVGRKMYDYVRTRLDFDQLIFERNRKTGARWLHISYRSGGSNRRQAFELAK